MAREIEILPRARAELKALPAKLQREAIEAIDSLADDPHSPDSVKLRGRNDYHRLRLGGYRIVYRIRPGKILVSRIAPRAIVYRGF
jgi:mRNA-degrading endonuclease RelE of RelBE toxin-antitoxin system